jgi:5-methylcytosine-specific restriction endonuclease McrA
MNDSTRHGHRNGYYVDKCRCDACRAAAAQYTREMRAKRKGNTPPEVHGTRHGYTNFQCRCEPCKAANAEYLKDFRLRPGKAHIARETSRRWAMEHPEEFAARSRAITRRASHKRNIIMRNGDVRTVTDRDWQRLSARYDHRCFYCGKKAKLAMDHIIPVARGGRHAIGNLIPACKNCNSQKRTRLIVEWRAGKPAAA